jgi:CheY-like chemotaxis protein
MMMVRRRSCKTGDYDALIADIRLPDIKGYELLVELKQFYGDPPLILMTGYGYDPCHTVPKAREEGLRTNAVLYKPFRLEQLLEILEATVTRDAKPLAT